MARKNVARIPHEKFVKIAEKLGMVISIKGNETKFFAPGTTKTARAACVSVPNTKQVTRVEVVNFVSEFAIPHPKPSAKSVTGMIDFAQEPKMVLSHVYKTCKAICAAALVVETPPAEAPTEQPAAEVAEAPIAQVG